MIKNGFLTFCFSFIPGAGEMYQCYMKRGISIMLIFAVFCVATWIIPVIGFFLPLIWFFSFFDTWTLRTQMKLGIAGPDAYLPIFSFFFTNGVSPFLGKSHKYIGIGLIIVGAYIFIQEILIEPMSMLIYAIGEAHPYLASAIDRIIGAIPMLAVSLAIIWLGIRLIRGKKVPVIQEEDYVAYARAEQNAEPQAKDENGIAAEDTENTVYNKEYSEYPNGDDSLDDKQN